MALQVAPAVGYAGVFEFQSPGCSVRPNNGRIEINQVAVVQPCALNGTDAVSIVTCRARNLLLQVFGMLCETFIVQDAVSAVASIAKLIRIIALLCIIGCVITVCEKIRIIGAVGAFGSGSTIRVMAIGTVYHGRDSHRWFKAGNVLVNAGRDNGMK